MPHLSGCARRALLVCLLSTAAGAPLAAQAGAVHRILFIGNSYTYWNQLPAMVRALADSAGMGHLGVETIAFADAGLEDHWRQGTAQRRLAEEHWDLVVLQQGPSSLPESRANLLEWVQRFAKEIQSAGGRPALYGVWPSRARLQDYGRATESYAQAAARVDGMLFPAAEAWRAAWRRDAALDLYGPDGLHPTPLGSYLVALVMVSELSGRSPRELATRLAVGDRTPYLLDVPGPTARVLQDAAAEAIARYGRP